MAVEIEGYNEILESVRPPKPIRGVPIDSDEMSYVREQFFDTVRSALERKISRGAITACTYVERIGARPQIGDDSDTWYELSLKRRYPLAYAVETHEKDINIVRFGVYPANKKTLAALHALEEADGSYTDILFRG